MRATRTPTALFLAALVLAALLASAPAAWSQGTPGGGGVGPSAAAAAARNATGGRVLEVRSVRAGGRLVYRVKVLLPGGRVRTVSVDGTSGRVGG